MSQTHDHPHDDTPKPARQAPSADAGSQALDEALRSSFTIVKAIMVILVLVFVISGIKTVGPQERAVIFRFGKPTGVGDEQLLGPGFHWAWPYPIDEVVTIPIGEIQSVRSTAGWYATTPEMELAGTEPQPGPSLNPAFDGYALTADGNILHVRATLSYRVTDALAYAFNFVNASNTVQNILDNAIIYAAAQSTVDSALKNSAAFKERILARVTELSEAARLGITLEPSDVKVIPPRFVKPAFDEVINAEQNRSTAINKARGDASAILSAARGEAAGLLSEGLAARARMTRDVAAEATAFDTQLPRYQENPALFRQRLLTETWNRILTNSQDKIFVPERADGKEQELRLLLSREPQKARTSEPAAKP